MKNNIKRIVSFAIIATLCVTPALAATEETTTKQQKKPASQIKLIAIPKATTEPQKGATAPQKTNLIAIPKATTESQKETAASTKVTATQQKTSASQTKLIAAPEATTQPKTSTSQTKLIAAPEATTQTKTPTSQTKLIAAPEAATTPQKGNSTPAKEAKETATQQKTTTPQTKLIAIPKATTTLQKENSTPAKDTATQHKTTASQTKLIAAPEAATTPQKGNSTPAKEAKETATKANTPTPTKSADTKAPVANEEKSVIARIKNAKVGIENYFVSVDWLKKNIKSCVLVDCRPSSLYKTGHLPGAVNAEWTYFAKINVPNGTETWGTVLSPVTLSARIGALGINGKKPVVLYCDDKSWGQSGWALWVLKQAGLQNVYILDGGYTEWRQHGGNVSKAGTAAKPVAFKVKQYVSGFSIDTETLSKNLDKVYLLDVRTKEEYLGKIRPFQEKRAGHIPGAKHIEKDNVVDEENLVKTKELIDELLAGAGIGKDKPIVVYDTAGVRSAFVTMVLCCFGYPATNYDAGFQAWAGNPDLPIEK